MYVKNLTKAVCSHCGHKGTLVLLAGYVERERETSESPCGYLMFEHWRPWGEAFELLRCGACHGIMLRQIIWHDQAGPEDYTYKVLYPATAGKPAEK